MPGSPDRPSTPGAPPDADAAPDTAAVVPGAAGRDGNGGAPAAPDGDAVLRALDPQHIDALAHRLVGPLGRLFRAELRLGRERAGRLLDGGR
ncbi:hypothetical protein [Streptomyces carminius]|uniref:hypothetical protein n=1 Tax=Streptomyces carminius TaxID=2665496 RepID=UPI0011B663E0|nr:hypothetical protein [Streptomyces carminius]